MRSPCLPGRSLCHCCGAKRALKESRSFILVKDGIYIVTPKSARSMPAGLW